MDTPMKEWVAEARGLPWADRLDLVAQLMASAGADAGSRAEALLGRLPGYQEAIRLELASHVLASPEEGGMGRSIYDPSRRRVWPLVGGPGLRMRRDVGDRQVPLLGEYRSGQSVKVTFSTCSGLEALGKAIGHPIHAVTTGGAVVHLNAERHAGWHALDGSNLADGISGPQPGFDDWRVASLETGDQSGLHVSKARPVTIEPDGMDFIDLVGRLNAMLRRCGLVHWVDFGGGAARLASVGGPEPHELVRAMVKHGEALPAADLVLIDAAEGAHRLARLLEDMCVRFSLDLE